MAARVTQAQLERALGGASKLLQLADRNSTGNLNDATCQAFVAEVLIEGSAHVDSYVGLAVDLSDPALVTSPLLIRYELAVDVYLSWLKGAGAIAMPEPVKSEYEHVDGELQKIAARQKGLGLPTRPSSSQPIQRVTKQDTEDFFDPKGPRRRFDGWS